MTMPVARMEIGNKGATLSLEVTRQHGEMLIVARYKNAQFAGEAIASDFVVGSPARMFAAMADNWRGWTGTMEWSDHEDRLALSAKSDSLGHVTLTVTMRRQEPFAQLTGTIMIDAGQLEQIADEMALFG